MSSEFPRVVTTRPPRVPQPSGGGLQVDPPRGSGAGSRASAAAAFGGAAFPRRQRPGAELSAAFPGRIRPGRLSPPLPGRRRCPSGGRLRRAGMSGGRRRSARRWAGGGTGLRGSEAPRRGPRPAPPAAPGPGPRRSGGAGPAAASGAGRGRTGR